MKAIILNGALPGDDGVAPIEQFLTAALVSRGFEVAPIRLRDLTIAYCQGCFECWMKTPGICKTKDDAPRVARAIVRSEIVVFLTPVTCGGYSSELKKALDRAIGIVSPFFTRVDGEVHHKPRYARYPSLVAVGIMAERDEEQARIFSALAFRNAINMHAPHHVAGIVHRGEPDRARALIGSLVAEAVSWKEGAA